MREKLKIDRNDCSRDHGHWKQFVVNRGERKKQKEIIQKQKRNKFSFRDATYENANGFIWIYITYLVK